MAGTTYCPESELINSRYNLSIPRHHPNLDVNFRQLHMLVEGLWCRCLFLFKWTIILCHIKNPRCTHQEGYTTKARSYDSGNWHQAAQIYDRLDVTYPH